MPQEVQHACAERFIAALKELGIEILGDTKIKIPVSNGEDEYDLIIDEDDIGNEIDKSIKENYLDK